MAIGVVATIEIQDGKNAEFEAAFLALAEKVRTKEPGNVFYALHKSKSDPQVYKVLEQYHSEADLAAHGQSEHYKEAGKLMASLVASAPQVELLDAVE
jgi:quinol monooxygenase YgiN